MGVKRTISGVWSVGTVFEDESLGMINQTELPTRQVGLPDGKALAKSRWLIAQKEPPCTHLGKLD
jgi:hypothetical protein